MGSGIIFGFNWSTRVSFFVLFSTLFQDLWFWLLCPNNIGCVYAQIFTLSTQIFSCWNTEKIYPESFFVTQPNLVVAKRGMYNKHPRACHQEDIWNLYDFKSDVMFMISLECIHRNNNWRKLLHTECVYCKKVDSDGVEIVAVHNPHQGLYSLKRLSFWYIRIPNINLRWSTDRVRFMIGIPIPIRWCLLYNEQRPRVYSTMSSEPCLFRQENKKVCTFCPPNQCFQRSKCFPSLKYALEIHFQPWLRVKCHFSQAEAPSE